MNRRIKKLLIIFTLLFFILFGIISCCKNIKIDDFKPASVIFVVDASASNQEDLNKQKKFVKEICGRLDPEDKIKIIRVSEDAYLIFEGSPHNSKNISEALNEYTQYDSKEWGTAYGLGIKKALSYSKSMITEGYVPSVIVIGDLENEGKQEYQVNWSTLPKDIQDIQKVSPEFTMMFAFAHPQKLDFVKSKLLPVLGEQKLIISTEISSDKTKTLFLNEIQR